MDPEDLPSTLIQTLIDNSAAISQVSASLTDLNSRLFESNKRMESVVEELKAIAKDHEARLVDVEHNCRKEECWVQFYKRIDRLERAEDRREGYFYWVNRFIKVAEGITIAVILAVLFYVLRGGKIT